LGSGEDTDGIWEKVKPYSWAVLGVLGFYAIASSQDLWALARAAAAKELEKAGISRTEIDAGSEYNVGTQLTMTGKMNSHWVVNPLGAYDPTKSQTPVVVPKYRLEYSLTSETSPSPFSAVRYKTLLPQFHKQVRIDRS